MAAELRNEPSFVLRYRSTRSEVWRYYWRAWRNGFWRKGVALAAVAAMGTYLVLSLKISDRLPMPYMVAFMLAAFLLVMFLLALHPQLAFNTLLTGQTGIDTTIGNQSAHRDWSEISTVNEESGNVIFVVRRTVTLSLCQGALSEIGRIEMNSCIELATG